MRNPRGLRSSGAMAIVAVQIADLEIAGIVLKDAGLEPQSGDFSCSAGAGNVSE